MNDIKYLPLKQITSYSGEPIYDWAYISLPQETRLYYKPIIYEEGRTDTGFEFCASKLSSCWADDEGEPYDSDGSEFEVLIKGIAYFDGIRHLYFGDEKTSNYGYYYYPRIEEVVGLLKALRELELKYCLEPRE